jgi:hypothetical protein
MIGSAKISSFHIAVIAGTIASSINALRSVGEWEAGPGGGFIDTQVNRVG